MTRLNELAPIDAYSVYLSNNFYGIIKINVRKALVYSAHI